LGNLLCNITNSVKLINPYPVSYIPPLVHTKLRDARRMGVPVLEISYW